MNKQLIKIIAIFCFITASPATFAQYYLTETGSIHGLSRTVISISDSDYDVSPTVKVFNKKGREIRYDQLRLNDDVEVDVIKIGKKLLIDKINLTK